MSSNFARSLTELFKINDQTVVDDVLLNRLLGTLEARFKPLEAQRGDLDTAIAQVRQVGLDRINEVLTPAISDVLEIQERGFLIANSATPATLVDGDLLTFVVTDEAQRALFTPSPFTALTREATPDDYGVARTIAYDSETGEYLCEVLSVSGAPGPHEDWVIGALAGPTIAMIEILAQVLAARDTASGARDTAVTKAGEATAAAATAMAKAVIATDKAAEAAASAVAAATFNPASYYTKAACDALLAALAPTASPALTGNPTAPTQAAGNNSTRLATTAFVQGEKASPALTGIPTAPTAAGGTNTTQIATTAFVQAALTALIASAPGALDTLNELATALGNDPNFATTMTNALAAKAPLASPTFTGDIQHNGRVRGNVTAMAALDIDCSQGNYFTKTINGASTFTFSNVPAGAYGFILRLVHTSGAITWPASVRPPEAGWPTLTTGKVHLFIFETDDAGANWRGAVLPNYSA